MTTSGRKTKTRVRLDVDERRSQLVELGLAEFGSRPYDEVSIDAIAQAAGISKGLVYHYFPTKRAFYIACVREGATRVVNQIEAPAEGTPFEQLRAAIDRYLEYVRVHGVAFATLMRSGIGADREITEIIDETRDALLNLLRSGLGELFPNVADTKGTLLDIALRGWIGLVESASIAWVEACLDQDTKNHTPTADSLRDTLSEALIAIVASALKTQGATSTATSSSHN
ncbi:MAG: TetR/AcrR family transcriptional regulator [Labilithrix sp.]|nr:TetR/AcrR family transcriptional regulator [Labilithrix sp.]MCW5813752.1 TetR/AcrR family transcriptional regulator [Labilithrix sp.]